MNVLQGRTALITGAAGGIGAAIAGEFRRAGATLALTDRDQSMLEPLLEQPAFASGTTGYGADLTHAAEVERMVRAATADHGRIDILVNAAGILEPLPFLEMDVETWDRTIEGNLRSVFLVSRAVVPAMVEARWGRVINIASQMGQKGGERRAHYSAAKAGVLGFTKAVAREVGRHNVLVNAIAPGPISTPLIAGMSAEDRRRRAAELPLGRFGTPAEVAPSALLLASDPGGNLYVGQTLGPNSGDVMA
ncbi:SDR family NAD(P)-dependent oxidoreductase [Ornithinicoccus halotolerans]|uniref:SDR family NAD(P)-dependent oxidoreductase n=1 Tax=Ornithinicoccus halotolerans TaxID=1748220 RepID=UPI001295AC5A|nr:SDR family oxidoreductase [Ornithinicoccus halotolerans]